MLLLLLPELHTDLGAVRQAFENLMEQRIVKQVSSRGAKMPKELRLVRLLLLPSQVRSAASQLHRLAEPLRQWALQGVVDLRAVLHK